MPSIELDPPPVDPGAARRIVLWRRRDVAGLERCETFWDGARLLAAKGVVLVAQDGEPASAAYELRLDLDAWAQWVRLRVALGTVDHDLTIASEGGARWAIAQGGPGLATATTGEVIAGGRDVDLGFTPLTNTLAIHRLGLAVGQGKQIGAAWLRFPELDVRLLRQRYIRLADTTYRYESDTGFVAELEVDDLGLVVRYGDIWERVAVSDGD